MVTLNSGLSFFSHTLSFSKSKDLQPWYIDFITYILELIFQWLSQIEHVRWLLMEVLLILVGIIQQYQIL